MAAEDPHFSPKFQITVVPRSSANFTIKDSSITYGLIGGPVDDAAIIDTVVETQYYGEEYLRAARVLYTGNIIDGLTVGYYLRDGVTSIKALYGTELSLVDGDITAAWATVPSTDGLKVTCNFFRISVGDVPLFVDEFANVTHLRNVNAPDEIRQIKSIDVLTNTIELYEAFSVDLEAGDVCTKYYSAVLRLLVVNGGEGGIIKDLSNMALSECGCDSNNSKDLIDRILLKLAAQVAFSCGNYAKAHNASVLLAKTIGTLKPCTTC